MRKYYANANMLLRKFSYCSPDVKCCMFKSYNNNNNNIYLKSSIQTSSIE